jgi:hypothetical protein
MVPGSICAQNATHSSQMKKHGDLHRAYIQRTANE